RRLPRTLAAARVFPGHRKPFWKNARNSSQSEKLDRTESVFGAGAVRRGRAGGVDSTQPLGTLSRAATPPFCTFAGGGVAHISFSRFWPGCFLFAGLDRLPGLLWSSALLQF